MLTKNTPNKKPIANNKITKIVKLKNYIELSY